MCEWERRLIPDLQHLQVVAESEPRGSPPNEELLQFLEQDLSTRTRRRVRRRVRDSDSDGPLMPIGLRSEEEDRRHVGQRRVVLVPAVSQGTPHSVQDREQPSSVTATIPASSGSLRRSGHNVAPCCRPTQLDSDDTILAEERTHRVASRRLVLVGCAHPTNSSAPETEVGLQPGSTVPASSGSVRDQQHPAVVVPGGIQFRNSFEALGRNDEDDVPTDGNEVFFGDESETESLPDSDRGHAEPVEEFFPMEARPRFVNLGPEALSGAHTR